MKLVKNILIPILIIYFTFYFMGCQQETKNPTLWVNDFDSKIKLNEEFKLSIEVSNGGSNNTWITCIKGIPKENLNILAGTKNEKFTTENFYSITMNLDSEQTYVASIKLRFSKVEEHLLDFRAFQVDEYGYKIESSEINYRRRFEVYE